ncbi:MAG: LCP family protein [Veillonellales bacterium]
MPRMGDRLQAQRGAAKKRTISILIVIMAVAAVAAAAYYWFGGSPEQSAGGHLTAENKVNILVMGVDQRDGDVGRSDTLFVLTVDTKNKSVSMLSVPRDTRVKIPGHGWDKINHAYAMGGHKLSMKAVEGLLGINMDHYVLININGFKKIVDAIGGVDIDVEKRMYYTDPYDDNGGLVINLKPGLQHMDGETAIQYVRYRDEEGDIGRVQRQHKFMKAVLKEIASPSIIPKIPTIIKEVSSAVITDMSTGQMLSMAQIVNDAYQQGLRTDMVPGKPAYIDDVSYWLPDLVALRQHMAQTLGAAMDEKFVGATQREAAEYQSSIPKEMKVVEVPKAVQPPKAPVEPAKPKTGTPVSPPQPASSLAKVRVDVLNASGIDGAGARMASLLREQGFEVAGVSNSAAAYKSTVVISNTTDTAVINRLRGLPFPYALQITKDDSKSTQATVVIGKDYSGK